MLIQLRTDNHIDASEGLTRLVENVVTSALDRFSNRITRVEVYLSDENSREKGGIDKRCSMEARLAGLQPIAVTHRGETLEQVIDGAAEKLEHTLDRTLGRLEDKEGPTSAGGDQTI